MAIMLFGIIKLSEVFCAQARMNTTANQFAELIAGQQSVTAPSSSLADMCTGAAMGLVSYARGRFKTNIAFVINDHSRNQVTGSTDGTTVEPYPDHARIA